MRTTILLVAGVILALHVATAPAQQRRDGNLKVGDAATDFTIKDVEGKKTVKFSELKGKPVVLIFGSCT